MPTQATLPSGHSFESGGFSKRKASLLTLKKITMKKYIRNKRNENQTCMEMFGETIGRMINDHNRGGRFYLVEGLSPCSHAHRGSALGLYASHDTKATHLLSWVTSATANRSTWLLRNTSKVSLNHLTSWEAGAGWAGSGLPLPLSTPECVHRR